MYIRRDQSNLHFGSRRRKGSSWFFGIWFFLMILIVLVTLYFQSIQSATMQVIYGTPTPTVSAVTLAKQAEGAFHNGDVEEAVELYRRAAELEPDNLDIQFEYVRALGYRSTAGRSYLYLLDEALAVAEEVVQQYPGDARAQTMYTLALTQVGRSEEAIAAGLRAIDLAPQWAEAHAYLSMAYRDQGRWNTAIEQAEYAVQLNPNSVDAKRALALSLAFVGNFDLAIQIYQEAIAIAPRLDALYFELALYFQAQDRYDSAIAAYDQVLANDPRNVKAYQRKCETYFKQREDGRAQEACEQALQLDSTYAEAWRQLGMVRYTRRNYEGAIEAFQTCASIQDGQGIAPDQREVECWYLRGLAHYLLDECELAVPVFYEVLTMSPNPVAKDFTYRGLQDCSASDPNFDESIIPTPEPSTPVPPEPIGIY